MVVSILLIEIWWKPSYERGAAGEPKESRRGK
jgi:hypothetical protein